ncbi:MAG: MFS transporter [Candidatus Zixiibacteriota bacterium]|nr:MAG: MFS transporter [candidate division Zixibacteria bacterium]
MEQYSPTSKTGREGARKEGSWLSEYMAHLKLFSKNARFYLTGSFLMAINFAAFNLLYNLYLKESGFAEGDIGSLQSARALGSALVAIPAAVLISRVRLKPVLLIACLLFALFSFGLTVYLNLIALTVFAILVGVSFAFYRVASGPFFMRNSTPVERTHLFSFSFAMFILANMAGSAGSGNLVTVIGGASSDILMGYRVTLYIAILLGLCALLPFAFIRAAAPSSEENKITLSWVKVKQRAGFFLKITSANFLIGLGAGLSIPFLNLYFRDRFGLPPDEIGLYYFAVHCSMFLGTLSGPIFTKRLGLVRTIVVTQLASLPFMFILAYSYFLPIVVVAFILRGGLMNLGVPISTNFGLEMATKAEHGLVNALLMVSWTGGMAVSAFFGGRIIESHGFTVSINLTIFLYVLSALIYFAFFRKSEKRNSDGPGWVIPARGEL